MNQGAQCFSITLTADGPCICLSGPEISRRQLEQELQRLGISIPDSLWQALFAGPAGQAIPLGGFFLPPSLQAYVDHQLQLLSEPLTVYLSRKKMRAYLTINPAGLHLSVSEVEEELARKGICFGLQPGAVEQALLNPGTRILVAIGKDPLPGIDARILEYYQKPEIKPVLMQNGMVDYYELGYIIPIQAGAAIAQRIPATRGEPGCNVLGEDLPAPDGKNCEFSNMGKGVVIVNDLAVAEFDGALSWMGSKVHVTKMLTIPGDVDFSVGNLRFAGKILVAGNVREGFIIEAEDDIEVRGGVENARITSERGSVMIQRGIIGRDGQAFIKAGNNVAARFAQEAIIEAGQNIIVNEYVLRCHLRAGDSVLVQGRKGRIIGRNHIYAGSRIKAARMNNCRQSVLEVTGIERSKVFQAIHDLNRRLDQLKSQQESLAGILKNIPTKESNIEQIRQKLTEYRDIKEEYEAVLGKRNGLVSMLRTTRGEGSIEIGSGMEDDISLTIKQESIKLGKLIRNLCLYYDGDEKRIVYLGDLEGAYRP